MKKILAIAALVAFGTGTAAAGPSIPLGVRIGYTADSFNQFHFGGHARVGEIVRNLAFQPSVELGLGDNVTLLAGNADIFYEFTELQTSDWAFYAGGGVVLSYIDVDPGGDDTNFGLDIAGGARYTVSQNKRLFGEVRIGLEDAPDFKISVGLTFF
jgi:hypothetical protein